MTNAEPSDVNARLTTVEEQLEQLGDELDLIRTIQNGIRREVRTNSQTTAQLERAIANLANTANIALQIALRADQKANAILAYLRDRNGGSNPPQI